ncbi:MAG TPA: tRNA 2-thiocytidine(32) synthetase TtcA [Thermoanaerobacterales bacterium]|jgi:tRNA 2-thiocytidine biosynthesis protein TtcA|nr:tRNA 2-thiocytidine(32) synthetase TtcA [Thermoanaerobacterales bacterium]
MDRRYGKWFLNKVKKAIIDYNMIQNGDSVAVGISGGKDSIALLFILDLIKKYSPFDFNIVAVYVDLGLKMDYTPVEYYCKSIDIPFAKVDTHIAPLVFNKRKEKNPCSLCANMRRGALNNEALRLGCNKIALGHHADDLIETLFLNIIFTSRFATFEPVSFLSKTNLTLIRPLIYIQEKTLESVVKAKKLPVVQNPCPASGATKRSDIKQLLNHMEKIHPRAKPNILAAMKKQGLL